MDTDFIRLLRRHLERQRTHYAHMLDEGRADVTSDPLRIAALEDALDDIEMILDRLGKIGTNE